MLTGKGILSSIKGSVRKIFPIALDKASNYPDEIERWPVEILLPFDPANIKKTFRELVIKIIAYNTADP